MIKLLLCAFGFHDDREIGRQASMISPMPVYQCQRCGRGYTFHLSGTEYRYTYRELAHRELLQVTDQLTGAMLSTIDDLKSGRSEAVISRLQRAVDINYEYLRNRERQNGTQ
jgi:hypothetical protein